MIMISSRKVFITKSTRNKLSSPHHALNSLMFAPDGYLTATWKLRRQRGWRRRHREWSGALRPRPITHHNYTHPTHAPFITTCSMKALKCKPSVCFNLFLGIDRSMSWKQRCYVSVSYKAYEFVRRLLSNIHGRMRKPSVRTYVHTRAISRKRTRFSLRAAEKYTEYCDGT